MTEPTRLAVEERSGFSAEERRGALFAVFAYTLWGVAPLYFLLVEFALPTEIIVHRVLWSLLFLLALLWLRGDLRALFGLPMRAYLWLALSGALLAANWWTFVWALQNDRVMETSIGYYINPLVSMVLGVVVLAERLRIGQWIAVSLAALGIAHEVWQAGGVPIVGLVLAVTFGFYGLVRKMLGIEAVQGLALEALLLLPFALLAFLYGAQAGTLRGLDPGWVGIFYLALGGIVTSLPLLCFNAAAVRLPLVVLGLFQYLAPSITLLLAVFYYGETFQAFKWVTFGLIWLGLLVFTIEGVSMQRRVRKVPAG